MQKQWFILIFTLSLSACLGGRAPNTRIFILDPQIEIKKPVRHVAGTLYVREFIVPDAYDRTQMIERRGTYELDYRAHELWVTRPKRLLANAITKTLNQAGLFDAVESQYTEKRPTYELFGELHALNVDTSRLASQAHLSITLILVDFQTKNVLWRKQVDETSLLTDSRSSTAAKGLSQLLGKVIDTMVLEVSKLNLPAQTQP